MCRGGRVTITPRIAGVLLALVLATASAAHPGPIICAPGTAALLPEGGAGAGERGQGSVVQHADCSLELTDLRCGLLAGRDGPPQTDSLARR